MELVLHYIVERKRMDDLVSSMTDGRLKEQKVCILLIKGNLIHDNSEQ